MSQPNLCDYKKELLKIKRTKGGASVGKVITYVGGFAYLFNLGVLIFTTPHGSEFTIEDWLMLIVPIGLFVLGISIWGTHSLCGLLLLIINEIEAIKNGKQDHSVVNQHAEQSQNIKEKTNGGMDEIILPKLRNYKKKLLFVKRKSLVRVGKPLTCMGGIGALLIAIVLAVRTSRGSEFGTHDWLVLIGFVVLCLISLTMWGVYSLCDILLLIINAIEGDKNDKQDQSDGKEIKV